MKKPHLVGAVLGTVLFVVSRLLFHYVPGSEEVAGALVQRLPYVLFVLAVVLWSYYLPRYRKSARITEEGLRLLSEGRVAAALEQFETSRSLARSKVIPTYNIGLARLQLWQLEPAERELSSLEEREDLRPWFRAQMYSALALVAALDGRLRQAVQRLDEVKVLHQGAPPPLAVLAAAVLACRRGDWAEARSQLERPEVQKLGGPLLGMREALLAWSQEQLTGERRAVEVITVFGEASPDTLQAAWPELVSFLLGHAPRRDEGAMA